MRARWPRPVRAPGEWERKPADAAAHCASEHAGDRKHFGAAAWLSLVCNAAPTTPQPPSTPKEATMAQLTSELRVR
jgi:hypothetical protein